MNKIIYYNELNKDILLNILNNNYKWQHMIICDNKNSYDKIKELIDINFEKNILLLMNDDLILNDIILYNNNIKSLIIYSDNYNNIMNNFLKNFIDNVQIYIISNKLNYKQDLNFMYYFTINSILYSNYKKLTNTELNNKEKRLVHNIINNENACYIKLYDYILLGLLYKQNNNIIITNDNDKYYNLCNEIIKNSEIQINIFNNEYNDNNKNNLIFGNLDFIYDLIKNNKINNIESITIDNLIYENEKLDYILENNNKQLIFICSSSINNKYNKYMKTSKCHFYEINEYNLNYIKKLENLSKKYNILICISSNQIINEFKYTNIYDFKLINSNMEQDELYDIFKNKGLILTCDYDYLKYDLPKFSILINYDIDKELFKNEYLHKLSSYFNKEIFIISFKDFEINQNILKAYDKKLSDIELKYINNLNHSNNITDGSLHKCTLIYILSNLIENNELQALLICKNNESCNIIYNDIIELTKYTKLKIGLSNINDNNLTILNEEEYLNILPFNNYKTLIINHDVYNEKINNTFNKNIIILSEYRPKDNKYCCYSYIDSNLYNNYISFINKPLNNKQFKTLYLISNHKDVYRSELYEYILLGLINYNKNNKYIICYDIDTCLKYYEICKLLTKSTKIKVNVYDIDNSLDNDLIILTYESFYELMKNNKISNINSITIDNMNLLENNEKIDYILENKSKDTQLILISKTRINNKYIDKCNSEKRMCCMISLNNDNKIDNILKLINTKLDYIDNEEYNSLICFSSIEEMEKTKEILLSKNINCYIINKNMTQKELNDIFKNFKENNILLTVDYDYEFVYIKNYIFLINYDIDDKIFNDNYISILSEHANRIFIQVSFK
jgi:hypothetical protein